VIEHGERFLSRIDGSERADLSPLLKELAYRGMTEYAAFPLRAGGTFHNAATVATRQAGRFTA